MAAKDASELSGRRDLRPQGVDLDVELCGLVGKAGRLFQAVIVHLLPGLLLQELDELLVLFLPVGLGLRSKKLVGPVHAETGNAHGAGRALLAFGVWSQGELE